MRGKISDIKQTIDVILADIDLEEINALVATLEASLNTSAKITDVQLNALQDTLRACRRAQAALLQHGSESRSAAVVATA